MARADPHERGARTPGPGSHTARCAVSADESRARGQPPASLGARERAERSADDERRVRGRRSLLRASSWDLQWGGRVSKRLQYRRDTAPKAFCCYSAFFSRSEANAKRLASPLRRYKGLHPPRGGRATTWAPEEVGGRRRAPPCGWDVTDGQGEIFKEFYNKTLSLQHFIKNQQEITVI